MKKVLCPVSRLECLRETCAVWVQSEKRCGLTGARPADPDRLYTVKEAAEYLNIHEMTMYFRLRSGEIRGVRTGRLWRIPESSLREATSLA
jgi:acetyl-CoA synthetase